MAKKKKLYLYGKNSVQERLIADPSSIKRIFIQENFNSPRIMELIEKNNISYKIVTEKDLLKIKRADRLQGIVAEAEPFKYTPFEHLLKKAKDSGMNLIFLDGLNDPQNLGSIIRICACFGNFGIVIPEHGSCEVNDTVVHVASGGENYVPVSMVGNLTTSLLRAKKAGFWAVGTDVSEGEDLSSVSLPFPLCIVLGSEGRGVRYGLRKHLDMTVSIKMRGAPLSLNVAMACSIICYEVTRQSDTRCPPTQGVR